MLSCLSVTTHRHTNKRTNTETQKHTLKDDVQEIPEVRERERDTDDTDEKINTFLHVFFFSQMSHFFTRSKPRVQIFPPSCLDTTKAGYSVASTMGDFGQSSFKSSENSIYCRLIVCSLIKS